MFNDEFLLLAEETLETLRTRKLTVATAESCTAGLVSGCLASIGGSSDVLESAWVTYSNRAKMAEIGVKEATLAQFGAVSQQTAQEMAEGILDNAPVDIGLSVTGIAGPGGGSAEKPVGLVWFGLAQRNHKTVTEQKIFPGDRNEVRMAAVAHGLQMIKRAASPSPL